MEEELNFLSEKIEELDHNIDITEFGITLDVNSEDDLRKLQKEKQILESVLNFIT